MRPICSRCFLSPILIPWPGPEVAFRPFQGFPIALSAGVFFFPRVHLAQVWTKPKVPATYPAPCPLTISQGEVRRGWKPQLPRHLAETILGCFHAFSQSPQQDWIPVVYLVTPSCITNCFHFSHSLSVPSYAFWDHLQNKLLVAKSSSWCLFGEAVSN